MVEASPPRPTVDATLDPAIRAYRGGIDCGRARRSRDPESRVRASDPALSARVRCCPSQPRPDSTRRWSGGARLAPERLGRHRPACATLGRVGHRRSGRRPRNVRNPDRRVLALGRDSERGFGVTTHRSSADSSVEARYRSRSPTVSSSSTGSTCSGRASRRTDSGSY